MQSIILTQGCGCSVSRQLIHPSKKDVLVLSDHKLIMNCKISPFRTGLFFFFLRRAGGGGGGSGGGGPAGGRVMRWERPPEARSLTSKLVIRPPKLHFQHLR